MLWGALLTVLLMVMRLPPTAPTLRMSSLGCLKAVWPENADCWTAEVAMAMNLLLLLWPFLVTGGGLYRRGEDCSGLRSAHVSGSLLVDVVNVDFHVDFLREVEDMDMPPRIQRS